MSGPAIVVVAGFVTLWLALRSDDGVVAEDYYKRGLLINREIAQTQRAAGLAARVVLGAEGRLEVQVAGSGDRAPPTLRLRLAHATRAGLDREALLTRTAEGTYVGIVAPLPAGRWLATLAADAWRLPTVEVTTPATEFRLGGTDVP